MGHSASYYWKGKNFNTLFFTAVPFGMIAPEQHAWFYYGGGMELMKKVCMTNTVFYRFQAAILVTKWVVGSRKKLKQLRI